jgi:glucose/arabinose dehydrogenase
VAQGLSEVVDLVSTPETPSRLLIAERGGRIRVFENGTLKKRDLLSLEEILVPKENLALTSIAVPPNYAQRKAVFVSYTDRQGDIVIGRFEPNESKTLDADDLKVVMKVVQPIPHNERSRIAFGPEGYLYIALGDTPNKSGAEQHAQDLRSPFGKVLRIDVSNPDRYTVPRDTPPRKESERLPEIWAVGFQNPLHLAFDPITKAPFLIDSGGTTQEIQRIERDKNYGWDSVEGSRCLKTSCDMKSFTSPLLEYSAPSGHPAIGGAVYRGSRFPSLRGSYLFVDSEKNVLYELHETTAQWTRSEVVPAPVSVTVLGEGADNEVFVATGSGALLTLTTP